MSNINKPSQPRSGRVMRNQFHPTRKHYSARLHCVLLLVAAMPLPVLANEPRAVELPAFAPTYREYWNGYLAWHVGHWSKYADATDAPTVRSMAIDNLTRHSENFSAAAPVLARRLELESDSLIKSRIIDGLYAYAKANPNDKTSADALYACFSRADEAIEFRNATLQHLVALQDPRMLPALYAYLEGNDVSQQVYALEWLPQITGDDVGEHIHQFFTSCVRNGTPPITENAIVALGKMKYAPCKRDLLLLMQDNRMSMKYWPVLITAVDTIAPNEGTRLQRLILDEEAKIKEAEANLVNAEARYVSAMAKWEQDVKNEKQRRKDAEIAALKAASAEWFKSDLRSYQEAFGRAFATEFARSRASEMTGQFIDVGRDSGKRAAADGREIISNIQRYTVTVNFIGPNIDMAVDFFFVETEQKDGFEFDTALLMKGALYKPDFLQPDGARQDTEQVQIQMGRRWRNYKNPNAGLPDPEMQFRRPTKSDRANSPIPSRTKFIS